MPFYKYVIETQKTRVPNKPFENETKFDDGYFANQRMVNIIHHLSQLIKIADDMFGGIENECRSIYERTNRLNIKMRHCQEIVDNLNAKAVKVPIGSLSESKKTYLHFKSCDIEEIGRRPIFSSYPRPPAVDKLRNSADGPSPPVAIPCGMVASEVDGFSGSISNSETSSTHIYCKPGKINLDKSRVNKELEDSNGHGKNVTSAVKVTSTVVPIDVSGQPFSRMASFRRSLIHVDFLMRRKKKKDKRRNTVTEGDVKELKDALHKIVTDEHQFTLPNSICTYQQIITESKNGYNSEVCDGLDNQQNEINSVEQNNNTANIKSQKKDSYTNSNENQNIHEEKNKIVLNGDGLKKEPKLSEVENATRHLSSSKRKAKSHIPISTVSAAMNVAVEMRQCNGIKESPVLNDVCNNSDHNSSDSDNKLQEDKRYSNSSCNEESSQDESWTRYKKKLQDKCRTLNNRKILENHLMKKEIEVSSSASSENIDPQENPVSTATSTESDAFFISSDESDEGSSDAAGFQDNYGSSTSVGTASDGSLNSLLSETGTEMTSSTGTLTSIGHEHLFSPPPPPPPMILSATVRDRDIVEKLLDDGIRKNTDARGKIYVRNENILQKQTKQPKPSKSVKTDIFDLQRNVTGNSKNIFTSLVSLKTHSKDKKLKNKDLEKKKINKNPHPPTFDMYGNNSPTKAKQIPAFIKENISPVIKNEEKSHMKSFFTNDKSNNALQFPNNEDLSKPKSDFTPQIDARTNVQNISDATKTKGIQTVSIIPPKYAHQVIVTPVKRYIDTENKNICPKGSLITENKQSVQYSNMQRPSSVNTESQTYAPRIQRPQPPTTLQHDRSKLAARVVLDLDGKVIYTTNSLDRKHCVAGHTVNMHGIAQNKICDPYFKDNQFNNNNSHCCSYVQKNYQAYPASNCKSNTAYSQRNATMYSSVHVPNNHMKSKSENEYCITNAPYAIRQSHLAAHVLSPQSHMSETVQTFIPKKMDTRPFSYAGNSSDVYFNNSSNNLLPDPNISGLPVQETMLTRHNVNLHSEQMERMNTSASKETSNRLSDNFCLSPSSQKSSSNLSKSPQSTMSTEDLFAVIHDCKKRMNIKTDSDISLASSSRSSSPSYLRPSSSKGTLAETGFLSPRSYAHLEVSGDRRSWADFRPVKDSVYHERKSLASDRLGPTKPTSMHDFKMLLLQARTSSQISGPRKSAVEMLKIPLNQSDKNNTPSLPLNLSPRNSISISAQNSPTVELSMYNGHSTVPFKRGNRVRTSLQSRYIMYPPIFEDCSEDSENCNDLMSDNPATSATGIGKAEIAEHSNWKHNISIQSDPGYTCDSKINQKLE